MNKEKNNKLQYNAQMEKKKILKNYEPQRTGAYIFQRPFLRGLYREGN